MFAAVTTAFGFLTRVPVPFVKTDARTFGNALAFFPVVGGGIGALLVAVVVGSSRVFTPNVAAFCVLVTWALITGGLHLDGLADTFDGLGGGRGDRARALQIMQDSRIGTHGAVALFLVLLGKFLVLADLMTHKGAGALWLAPLAARTAVVVVIALFRYARPDGLGKQMHDNARAHVLAIAHAFMLAGLWVAGFDRWPVVAAGHAAAVVFALWIKPKLGGLTGDTYGAIIEISELAALTALLIA